MGTPERSICPLCGAGFASGASCRERFDALLALEFANPDYFAVHHLTVLAYLLQHEYYPPEQRAVALRLLEQFLYEGLSVPEARRQQQKLAAARLAQQRVVPETPAGGGQAWSTRTIADVRADTAEQYRIDVVDWAAAVLAAKTAR